ncbi:hypothetical protein [Oryzomonas rubra]|uniref:Uncharacterized protein n=1 Tax=Oryzomonas rubra TaxID=2509454 RepID=A0A5A9X6U6_9BACT|nr:hypothetical protein [Oryzomonas rubra]KAA0888095.1 hypothetical protein ET418_16985 [Oryzomonas rubra]
MKMRITALVAAILALSAASAMATDTSFNAAVNVTTPIQATVVQNSMSVNLTRLNPAVTDFAAGDAAWLSSTPVRIDFVSNPGQAIGVSGLYSSLTLNNGSNTATLNSTCRWTETPPLTSATDGTACGTSITPVGYSFSVYLFPTSATLAAGAAGQGAFSANNGHLTMEYM